MLKIASFSHLNAKIKGNYRGMDWKVRGRGIYL